MKMDIRGVEITNQLRSAIRAKLLELGVRYDEELPDYILVMVVNKKSRQQMSNDLYLFLETNTEPFVNWLHDQVLRKLQKVTVKKKSNREIRLTSIVKEEKEQKKIKIENQSKSISDTEEIITKVSKDREFEELVGDLTLLNKEDKTNFKKSIASERKLQKKKNCMLFINSKDITNLEYKNQLTSSIIISKHFNNDKKEIPSKLSKIEVSSEKISESSNKILKRPSNIGNNLNEKNTQSSKRSKISNDFDNKNNNKFKLPLNKPKITSVVSVKTRLGLISPTKKHSISQNLINKNHVNISRNGTVNQKINLDKKKYQNIQTEQTKDNKINSNINLEIGKLNTIEDNKKILNYYSGTIKSRLGNYKQSEQPSKIYNSVKISKSRISNIKSRLGVRKRHQIKEFSNAISKFAQITKNNSFQEDDDSVNHTSLKSHIIAIKKQNKQTQKNQNDFIIDKKKEKKDKLTENEDQSKISSKIIVTPRPLKPLKPSQKRATQSLLLRAVAEANQSVVMQKKMDPCLKELKSVNKIKIMNNSWQGKIVSVNLNSKKRFVMERIQVELSNPNIINSSKPHLSQVVSEEHLDMVKSLFKRSDDKQKFLVTLNGYNSNNCKERSFDNEHIEIEMDEDNELSLTNSGYVSQLKNNQMIDKNYINKNQYIDENHDMHEDTEIDDIELKVESNLSNSIQNLRYLDNSKKKRKLSPIIYSRSYSSSPENKCTLATTVNSALRTNKQTFISSVVTTVADKSNEKCRYWPNCTLGVKCAYYHPEVLCSSFPVCKFGEKCAYKHPKCKFGSSCTKLSCMFSHPQVQCKYHPYCMKPGCPFSHPITSGSTLLNSLTPDISNVRAKFTWKKKE